jgi:PKD repeat protein
VTWSWGDGTSGRTSRDFHVYDTAGEYTVTVTARDPEGNTATATHPVTVFADSLLLEATSNFPEGVVTTADTIQFGFRAESCDIDYPAVLGDSVKVQILWEMNDPGDNTYRLAQPRFRYTTPGDYTVDLTVTYPAWAVTRKSQLQFTVNP